MDLPEQYLLQQGAARPVSGDELEAMGKRASAGWRSGEYPTLTDAVVGIVKRAQLSPEQVRRVTEFTNQDAYLFSFKKEGSHKVVHFDCGPADPSEVLKDLNDGGGGTVFDQGRFDYATPPTYKQASHAGPMDKTAGEQEFNPYEEELLRLFASPVEHVVPHDITREPRELWYKLASAREDLQGQLDRFEIELGDAAAALEREVKQASREGVGLGDIVRAWNGLDPEPEYVKAAFQVLAPMLKQELGSYDAVGRALEKTGSAVSRIINAEHPLIQSFAGFADALAKLASVREAKEEVDDAYAQIEAVVKEAALGGMAGKAWHGLGHAGEAVGEAVAPVAEALVGAHPEKVKNMARTATQLGGAGAGLLAANAAQQEITDRPGVRSAVGAAKSIVPGTQEYNMRRMRIMNGGMY